MARKRVKTIRKFSEAFKLQRVKEYENGDFTALQLAKMFSLHPQTVYNWIYKYSTYNKKKIIVVEAKNSSSEKLKQQEKTIKELEQIIGKKQIQIDYLEKMVAIASEKLDYDIKKNFASPPLFGLNNKNKK